MMAIDMVWITILGFYLEMVMPKTFGRRRTLCFCISPSFWGCKRKGAHQISSAPDANKIGDLSLNHESVDQTYAFETKYLNPDCYEKLSSNMDQKELEMQLLKVTDLHKEYDNGFKAVNGMNFKMYAD